MHIFNVSDIPPCMTLRGSAKSQCFSCALVSASGHLYECPEVTHQCLAACLMAPKLTFPSDSPSPGCSRWTCFGKGKVPQPQRKTQLNKQPWVLGDSREELEKDTKRETINPFPRHSVCSVSSGGRGGGGAFPLFVKEVVDATIHFLY